LAPLPLPTRTCLARMPFSACSAMVSFNGIAALNESVPVHHAMRRPLESPLHPKRTLPRLGASCPRFRAESPAPFGGSHGIMKPPPRKRVAGPRGLSSLREAAGPS
jgi:hypothetical protein